MSKEDIASRKDIELLVRTFYSKVRQHPDIGHFFNETITDWEGHFQKLTDFWQNNLFLVNAYHGNPMRIHKEVDQNFAHSIEQAHFGNWLELWFSTIDDLFAGPTADLAKERARNIAHLMFMKIFQNRQNK